MKREVMQETLYEKMIREHMQFRKQFLTLPPEQMLEKVYECAMREDILLAVDSNDLQPEQLRALLRSPTPLADIFQAWQAQDYRYKGEVYQCLCKVADEKAQAYKEQHQKER